MPEGLTANLLFAIFAGAFGSAFQHGYNTGVMNSIQNVTSEWIQDCRENVSSTEPRQCAMSDIQVTLLWSCIVSIFCLGGMVGGLAVSKITSSLGIKKALLFNNIFVAIGAVLMGCSELSDYSVLLVGRFVIGISAGFSAGLAPMYVSEIAPANLRGALGTFYQLVITMSILLSQILGLNKVLGTRELWPVLLAITVVPGLLQISILPFCPESPKYLFIKKSDTDKTEEALKWLRKKKDVALELLEYQMEKDQQKNQQEVSFIDVFYKLQLRRPLLIAVMMMLAQQLSGINAIIFYSTDVFKRAGLSLEDAQYATIGMGLANVVASVLSIFIIERAGRKTLMLVGLGGMLGTTVILMVCLYVTGSGEGDNKAASAMAIFAVYGFVVFFAVGPGPIPWFFVSELFNQNARPIATSIAVGVNWAANFLVGWTFQPLVVVMKSYVFLIFVVLQLIFIIYVWLRVPETKDRRITEIAQQFET